MFLENSQYCFQSSCKQYFAMPVGLGVLPSANFSHFLLTTVHDRTRVWQCAIFFCAVFFCSQFKGFVERKSSGGAFNGAPESLKPRKWTWESERRISFPGLASTV